MYFLRNSTFQSLAALWIAALSLLISACQSAPPATTELPPAAHSRELSFVVERGTWLSLDVAPDDGSVVFELLGDIYRLPAGGGEAQALTRGPSFDSQPAVSGDGTQIAFISDRSGAENLWVMNADGSSPRQITFEHWGMFASPVWRPDSEAVVVSRTLQGIRSGYELIEFDLTGQQLSQHSYANPTRSVDEQISAMGAAYSADGRYLYYAQRKGRHPRRVSLPVWSIRQLDLATGADVAFVEEEGGAFRPQLSADGQWLAYGTRLDAPDGTTGIKLMNLHTGESRAVVQRIDHDDQESEDFNRDIIPAYSFSPDSQNLVISVLGHIQQVPVSGADMRKVPFSAPVEIELANPGVPSGFHRELRQETVSIIQEPDLSPDGRQLVFSALNKLFLLDLETEDVRPLGLGVSGFHPSWSPDGNRIAFVTWSPVEGGNVWTQDVRQHDSAPVQVTHDGNYYADLAWISADEIFATRAPLESRLMNNDKSGAPIDLLRLVSISPETGQVTDIINAPQRARGYQRQIGGIHGSAQPGDTLYNTAVGLFRLAGGQDAPEFVSQVYGPTSFDLVEARRPADEIQLSPDGSHVLARIRQQVVLVPNTGEDAIFVSSPKDHNLSQYGADYFGWSRAGDKIFWTLGDSVWIADSADVLAGSLDPREVKIEIDLPQVQQASKRLLLTGATLLTMTGSEPLTGYDILIEGNRIAAIAPAESFAGDTETERFDLSGKYILPGFIDLHAHFSILGRGGVLDETVSPFLANLAYGVTTVRDPQSFTIDMLAYRDLVDAGLVLGPRIFTTGPAIQSDHDFQSRDEIEAILTGYRDYYDVRAVKFYLAGNRAQQREFLTVANEMGMQATSEGTRNFKWDLTRILDGIEGHEHPIPHAPLYDDVLKVLAESGVIYTPVLAMTPTSHSPLHGWEQAFRQRGPENRLERFVQPNIIQNILTAPDSGRPAIYFREQAQVADQIAGAGGYVGVGAHALRNLQGIRYHWEMWTLAADGQGMAPMDILRSATVTGAMALGLDQELGTLETGKIADLIVLERNPLADIRNTSSVVYTMLDGTLYESETLEELWPLRANAPELWWHDPSVETRASLQSENSPYRKGNNEDFQYPAFVSYIWHAGVCEHGSW